MTDLIAIAAFGRVQGLTNGECRSDNRLENLQLRQGRHGSGIVLRCRGCGSHDLEAVPLGT